MTLKSFSPFRLHASLRLGWTGAVRTDRTVRVTFKKLLVLTYLLGVWLVLTVPLVASDFQMALGNGAAVTISLELSPDVNNWRKISTNAYSGDGYELDFGDKSADGRSELTVQLQRADGQPFVLQNFQAAWEVQAPGLFAIWTANQFPAQHHNYRALSTESFADLTAPNSGIPYALAATREGKSLLAVGLMSQNRVMNLRGWPQPDQGYQIALDTRTPLTVSTFNETLFTDTTPLTWFDITQRYADWVDARLKYQPFPIAPACYYPMYDSWYWSFDNTSIDLYWKTLVQAKDLGFQTYLFDAGWGDEAGELSKWLSGALGNYTAPDDKLPGFAGFLQTVKDQLQMNVILWMAPYAMGRQSFYYSDFREDHDLFVKSDASYKGGLNEDPETLDLNEQFQENVNLCPQNPATQNHLRSLFERVSQNYRPSGYWLDFQDFMPFLCESPHSHTASFGEGYNASQQQIKDTVLDQSSQPTVEIRYPIANLNNKSYANLWQSLDSPGDYDGMRLCSLLLRPFSRGIVMGTDEMYWPPESDDTTVAKFVATTIFSGVPAFGPNFMRGPSSHAEIVKAWLSFYRMNQRELTDGLFQPIGDFVLPDQMIQFRNHAYVYLRSGQTNEVPLDGNPQIVYLVNCTESDSLTLRLRGLKGGNYQVEIFDPYLKTVATSNEDVQEDAGLARRVPQGGMLKLVKMETNQIPSDNLEEILQQLQSRVYK